MNRFFIFVFMLLWNIAAFAQVPQERVKVNTDRQCYVVGEHLKINVDVELPDGTPSPSRVAYVEIADTAQLHAQAMLALDGGRGYGEIALPPTMHSGVYQLTVYTRGMRNFGDEAFYTANIGVINPLKLSYKDNFKILPADSDTIAMVSQGFSEVNTQAGGLRSLPGRKYAGEYPFAYELEGHIVSARVDGASEDIANVRLALVGKTTMIFDGRRTADGNYEFYTTGIYGTQPSMVSAYAHDGRSLSTELLPPYAQVLPSSLPQLVVRCSEDALKHRYEAALRQATADEWQQEGPQTRKAVFMGTTPVQTYDLDEWTAMNSVDEMIMEFIRGVSVRREKGSPQIHIDARCPALVLFDGIPVYDIQKFLDYDPHHLKYVQIYDDRYTFGQTYCYGVVSFLSRSGALPNYTLDEGNTFAAYQFPQQMVK